MSTARVRGVRVALEGTFANVASTTGIPSTAGLTFYTLEADAANITTFGDPTLNERNDARSDWYSLPPEPETMWSGGSRVRRRTGTITLSVPLRGIGDPFAGPYATYAAMPLHMLLQSGMTAYAPAGALTDDVAANVSANRWTPTSLAAYEIGQGIAYDRNNRREYAFVTDNPADVYVSPGFSGIPAIADTMRMCETLFSRAGTAPGSSVALELTGDGWRTYAYGCRMQSVTITTPPRKATLDITIQCAFVTDDHAGGILSQNPARTAGAVAHALGSYAVISATSIGTTTPATLGRTVLACDEWTFTLTNTLTPRGWSNDITGMSDMEVTSTEATARLVGTVESSLASDLWNQTERSLLLGLGPIGQGNGAAFYIPAAVLQVDASKREYGTDRVRMELQYRNGLWSLDDTAGMAAGAPGDSSVRIALSY